MTDCWAGADMIESQTESTPRGIIYPRNVMWIGICTNMFIRFLISAIHKGNDTDAGCVPFLFLHMTFICINNNSWLIINQQQYRHAVQFLITLVLSEIALSVYSLCIVTLCTQIRPVIGFMKVNNSLHKHVYLAIHINIFHFLCIVVRHAVRLRLTSNFLCHCWTMPKYWIAFSPLLLFIVPAWMQSGEDVPADLDIAGECTWY